MPAIAFRHYNLRTFFFRDTEIEISRRTEDKINKLFLDPTGNHLVVGMDNGDNFYLHSSFIKPKKLPKWQVGPKFFIESSVSVA